MSPFNPQGRHGNMHAPAVDTGRGEHPDLASDLPTDPDARMNHRAQDPAWREQHAEEVRRELLDLPSDVRAEVEGRHYAAPSYAEGYRTFQETARKTLKDRGYILDRDLERMSEPEYATYFDERGQPREGFRLHVTRGVNLQAMRDAAIHDASTAAEMQQAQRAARRRQSAPPSAASQEQYIDRTRLPGSDRY